MNALTKLEALRQRVFWASVCVYIGVCACVRVLVGPRLKFPYHSTGPACKLGAFRLLHNRWQSQQSPRKHTCSCKIEALCTWARCFFFHLRRNFFVVFLPFFCVVFRFPLFHKIGAGRLETLFQKLYLSTPFSPHTRSKAKEREEHRDWCTHSCQKNLRGGKVGCARRNRFTLFIHEVLYGAQVHTELQMGTIGCCITADLWRALNVQLDGIKGAL